MPEENFDQDQVSEEEIDDTEVQSGEDAEGGDATQKDERVDPRLIKGLQKGYTQTRQQMSSLDQKMSRIEQLLSSSGSKEHDVIDPDDVLTVGQFNKLIQSQKANEERARISAEEENTRYQKIIDEQLDDLKIEGIIDDGEEDALIQFAYENEIPNLAKAAKLFQREKSFKAEEERKKAVLKEKKKDAGQVGGSSKPGSSAPKPLSYKDIHNQDWDDIN